MFLSLILKHRRFFYAVIIDCAMNSCNLMQPAGFDALPESSFSPSLVDKPVLKLRDQKIAQAVGNVFFFSFFLSGIYQASIQTA